MSIDKHFEKRGVTLTDDNSLPQGERTQKNVKRVIAAVRAAESEFNDELRGANERCRSAQEQVIALQDRLRTVESELAERRLQERMDAVPGLSAADRRALLLEVSGKPAEAQAA